MIVGTLKEVLVAGEQNTEIMARLLAATTRIVSLTITEKGYCVNAAGTLDLANPDIATNLSTPQQPRSAIGLLVEGLRLRHTAGVEASNVLSCDNVSGKRPDWESVGVVFTDDVEGFEKAKLRLFNCLRSTLAYAGSLAGFATT